MSLPAHLKVSSGAAGLRTSRGYVAFRRDTSLQYRFLTRVIRACGSHAIRAKKAIPDAAALVLAPASSDEGTLR